jgi:hypothetical protein
MSPTTAKTTVVTPSSTTIRHRTGQRQEQLLHHCTAVSSSQQQQPQQHAGYNFDAKVIPGRSTMFEYEDHGPSNENEGTANVKEAIKSTRRQWKPHWLQKQQQNQQTRKWANNNSLLRPKPQFPTTKQEQSDASKAPTPPTSKPRPIKR